MVSKGRMTAAFVLVLIGGAFILAAGIWFLLFNSSMGGGPFFIDASVTINGSNSGMAQAVADVLGGIGTVSGVVLIASSLGIRKAKGPAARKWSGLSLAFSIVSLFGGAGFFIGFVLALVGSILGMTHKG